MDALQTHKPLSPSFRAWVRRLGNLSEFQRQAEVLEDALRQKPAEPEVPLGLHASIMHAVDRSADQHEGARHFPGMWWPASAFTALLLLGLWWGLRSEPTSAPLAPVAMVLEQSHEVARSMPGQMVGPLSDELQFLDQDVTKAAAFLEASLP
ncbi:MAG: hypothetical protein ACREIC_29820 [Limisphaerales bacterium]